MAFIIPQITDKNIPMLLSTVEAELPKGSVVALVVAGVVIYLSYFHSLSKFPGPKLWVTSPLPYLYSLSTGALPHLILQLHEHYGPISRIAPYELSFTTEEVWCDISGKFSAGRYSKIFARSLRILPERYLSCSDREFANEMRILLERIAFNFNLKLVEPEKGNWIENIPAFTFWEKTPLMVKPTLAIF